ncbi:AraC family transcriptional regulator [Massilia sp. Root418]|jgi:transcriptional regulator GlxA family with amidase domain|uniref:GlxA family transcriptional regulator n=1 Tax=Massilia sp. Root418 TaxID=1736532 RepID=UPI0006FE6687|nr:helix-turn-helix domain-containing protein [Massilia sp. Root418]KQW96743.1 AraC family transcriptional regulator [Massilia sp. Root418]
MTSNVEKPPDPATVLILVFPDFLLLDATGPVQVFSTANDECRDAGRAPAYRVVLVSQLGGAVASCSGIAVMTAPLPALAALQGATLIVAGGRGVHAALAQPALLDWVAQGARAARRCASVCTGAFMLAEAGLLAGRRAVTHWQDVDSLRRAYPAVQVQDDAIHIKDGPLYTSAGITAGIDLCLSLVEEDLGRAVAIAAAKRLVVYHKRPGGQRQFSTELLAQSGSGGLAHRLTQWLRPRTAEDIDVERMAAAMALSARSLHRRLREETGASPAQWLARVRMETACRLLESAGCSIKQVARLSGFGTEYNLRRAFAKHLGVLPSEYRDRFA